MLIDYIYIYIYISGELRAKLESAALAHTQNIVAKVISSAVSHVGGSDGHKKNRSSY
jgi:hypothetical protein